MGGPETQLAAAVAAKEAAEKEDGPNDTKLLITTGNVEEEDGNESSSSMDTAELEHEAGVAGDEDESEEDEVSVSRDVQETCFSCIHGPRGSGKTTQLRSIAAQISKDPLALVSTHRVIGAQTSLLSVMVAKPKWIQSRFSFRMLQLR